MSKHRILVFILLIAFIFGSNAAHSAIERTILKSNSKELIVKYKISIDDFQNISTNNQTLFCPIINGTEQLRKSPGTNLELYFSESISIPSKKGFSIENYEINKIDRINKNLVPTPEYNTQNDEIVPVYNFIETNFNKVNINRKPDLVYAGIASEKYIGKLNVFPLIYNENGETSIIREITIKIKFDDTNADVTNNTKPINTINGKDVSWVVPSKKNKKQKHTNELMAVYPTNWAKITVETSGVYQIDASMLSSINANIPASQVSTIKIFGYGGKELTENVEEAIEEGLIEQEIIVNTNGDGTVNNIVFYAGGPNGFASESGVISHYINHFSNKNSYILAWGGEDGKRAIPIAEPSGEVIYTPLTYIQRLFSEEEITNAWYSGSGKQWFGRSSFPYDAVNKLYNLDRDGQVTYSYTLVQRYSEPGDTQNKYFGTFRIYENNSLINSHKVYAANNDGTRIKNQVSIPASSISDDNVSHLKFEYSTTPENYSSAIPYMDYYEIHYPRYFSALDGEISWIADATKNGINKFTITNFSGNIYGWDISDVKNPKLLKNLSNTGSIFEFKYDVSASKDNQFFISSNIKKPNLEKINIANLRNFDNDADIIVVTHKDLSESASKYAEYRNNQGELKARVVFIDDIYNEFGYGNPDLTAIRNYLSFLVNSCDHKPRYVVLWGDGHYDFKNISSAAINYVPTYETLDDFNIFSGEGSYTTDDYFACVVGDDWIPDIAIGRIPIKNNTEGLNILNKIDRYENKSSNDNWKTTITFLADDSYKGTSSLSGDGTQHTDVSEQLAKHSALLEYNINKIYLAMYPQVLIPAAIRKPKVTEDLVSVVNTSGTNIINYLGHGNPRVLTHEEVFERDQTIPLFRNLDKLFFLFAGTCDFGKFDNPEVQSGAEELVKFKSGGAIGVFTATRSVYINPNSTFNQVFFNQMFSRSEEDNQYRRLGDIINSVKYSRNEVNDKKYNLIGDPVIRLKTPNETVSIDSINGIALQDQEEEINLKGLSKVHIVGKVFKSDGSFDADFNGYATLDMWDASENVKIKDNYDNSIHKIEKLGSALSKTSFKIINGTYIAEFFIPKDISYAEGLARITIFAFDTLLNKTAKGGTNKIRVNSIDPNAEMETEGPKIEIYLDSRQFKTGRVVSSTPLLIADISDNTGVNTTGAGIGHKIEAWIDDDIESIDLTNYYYVSLENPAAGTIEKMLFDLAPGEHIIKIRAWDVFNNYSVAYQSFRIGENGTEIVIQNTYTYPNPAESIFTFLVYHNSAVSVNTNIEIYDLYGKLVRKLNDDSNQLYQIEIPFDGLDDEGKPLLPGNYYYNAIINNNKAEGLGRGHFVIIK